MFEFFALVAVFVASVSVPAIPPAPPTWEGVFGEVQSHELFRDLKVSYAVWPQADMPAPLFVIEKEGFDCEVVMSDNPGPELDLVMTLAANPVVKKAFMAAFAAHEFGHCLRARTSTAIGEARAAYVANPESAQALQYLESTSSLDEALSDAYALVYTQATHPELFHEVLAAMYALRHEPKFVNAFYQVHPLYEEVARAGVDTTLPLEARADALMQRSKF